MVGGVRRPRGSYHCRLCGVPKKGHKCSKITHPQFNIFNLPKELVLDILGRLPLKSLSSAEMVCKVWERACKDTFKAITGLRVGAREANFFVNQRTCKSPNLVALSISLQSVVGVAVYCLVNNAVSRYEKLKSLELLNCQELMNTDDLDDVVDYNTSLTTLKMEGLINLRSFTIKSDTISTLSLSGLHSLPHIAFRLPNILDISLLFSQEANNTTDLDSLMDGLGRNCPKLVSIFISSPRLSHDTVLSLTAANLRELRMLSLINGLEINDSSVEAICKTYKNLELLDLSRSSITNEGIAWICTLSSTLTVLRVASCPKITLRDIDDAFFSLYKLEVIDCANSTTEESEFHIEHDDLKKISLLGCFNLVHLNLSCANLKGLNLNLCKELETCDLSKCPKLESVHVGGCQDILVENVQTQLSQLAMKTVVVRSESEGALC